MKELCRGIAYAIARRLSSVIYNAQVSRLQTRFKSCGRNVSIYMPVRIDDAESVVIGNDVAIGPFVHMWGGGGIRIGNGVGIGAHTAITSQGHVFTNPMVYLPRDNTVVSKPVVIEDNVGIGSHCVILPGVTIGQGALIGAGSVVNSDVKPFTTVVTGRQREEWPRRVRRTSQPDPPASRGASD